MNQTAPSRVGRVVSVAMFALSAIVLAACGDTAGSPNAITTVLVTVNDGMSFTPSHLTIPVGTTDIKIRNLGSIPHNLAIPALDAASPTVNGGTTVTMVVHATKPGTYPFVCTFHVMNGMVGTLVVRPARKS